MNTQLKERPIILTAEEVNAVLAGHKTQHRIPVDIEHSVALTYHSLEAGGASPERIDALPFECPFGNVGDQLWVQEDWIPGYKHDPDSGDTGEGRVSIIYKSDKSESMVDSPSYELAEKWMTQYASDGPDDPKWFNAKTMERWASRSLLEITDIRIERVQDTSHDDAVAEGVHNFDIEARLRDQALSVAQIVFSRHWDTKHQEHCVMWEDNPWVWVIEFKKVDD